jgi:hypothetical protein
MIDYFAGSAARGHTIASQEGAGRRLPINGRRERAGQEA